MECSYSVRCWPAVEVFWGWQSHCSEVRNQAAFAYVRWTATPKPVMRLGLDPRVGRVVGRLARNA